MSELWEQIFANSLKAGGVRRKRAFDFWEARYGYRLPQGEAGLRFYGTLLETVRSAGSAEAVKEFEDRFGPLRDRNPLSH